MALVRPPLGMGPAAAARRVAGDPMTIRCYMCGAEYDPTRHRWLCPICRCKDTCCDGEPLPLADCG